MDLSFLIFDTLGSTNSEAADHARRGANEGLCVIAREQTAGRGRNGRAWESESGQGAYFSLLLRPKFPPERLSLIPLAAAVAVYDVLQKDFLIEPDIKWPNDVLVGERKICGILSEAIDTPAGLAVIVGIGINLKTPLEAENATSIADASQFGARADDVAAAVSVNLKILYSEMHTDPAKIIDGWRLRSSFYSGKAVRVTLPVSTLEGVTDGLEPNGALRVKLADGSVTVVQAGDVECLRSEPGT